MDNIKFAHLHVHTEYSLLDGFSKIKDIIDKTKTLGMNSLAITDHGVMYGVVDFYKYAKKVGINPIIGCEVYIAQNSRFDRGNTISNKHHHLVLLAENNEGYKNLLKLVSHAHLEGFYYRPRVDFDLLKKHNKGLICLSACLAGEIPRAILRKSYEAGKEIAMNYKSIFGENNFYLELQNHGIKDQKLVNQNLIEMSQELNIPLVCTNDVHYTDREDEYPHDVLLCIQTKKTIDEENRMRYEGGQYFLKSPQEMYDLFGYVPEALENTQKIADRCNVNIDFHEYKLPVYKLEDRGNRVVRTAGVRNENLKDDVFDAFEYLRELCYEGLFNRYGIVVDAINESEINESEINESEINESEINESEINESEINESEINENGINEKEINESEINENGINENGIDESEIDESEIDESLINEKEIKERLKYELETIKQMGFVDYFLIVWDFIKYARDNNIIVGPGRGSAAGSIVAYCLEITDIDPIEYSLIFERFLNPYRVSMPDIDIDFCFERRQEVIDYVNKKYGAEKVSQIITFGTLAARNAIRGVGKALSISLEKTDKIAKMIPKELKITIRDALSQNIDLYNIYEQEPEIKQLIDVAIKLEGLPRHASTHAAGVVICDKPIMEYVPLSRNDEVIITQFPMTTIEELGLLKMDFLGLRTLTVIKNAFEEINRIYKLNISYKDIDYKDKKIYALIASGNTEGIFQLESAGMKQMVKELQPQNIEDIIAGISLYRPGPMQFIDDYIKGRHNQDLVKYDHILLEPILKTTYGCIVYQEQVMQIAQELAGYDLGDSDLLRRAMSKKKDSEMEKERKKFIYGDRDDSLEVDSLENNNKHKIEGCLARGVSEDIATKIFDKMQDFAKYAFNKSHAASYAVISCQTAWIKAYYPLEFMSALLTSVTDKLDKIVEYLIEIKRMDIELLPPDINEGFSRFTVSGDKIRFNLAAIKNVGKKIVDKIVEEREKNGHYKSMRDFFERLDGEINLRAVESLIKAGAFDSLGYNRAQNLANCKNIQSSFMQMKKNTIKGQLNLFEIMSSDIGNVHHEELKSQFEDKFEYIPELKKKQLLNYEKEVLGIYISGSPLDEYKEITKNYTSNKTFDFIIDEEDEEEDDIVDRVLERLDGFSDGDKDKEDKEDKEAGKINNNNINAQQELLYKKNKVKNQQVVKIGGIISKISIKNTKKTNQAMAYFSLEDEFGAVNIVVFPNIYAKYKDVINDGNIILLTGKVQIEDEQEVKIFAYEIKEYKELANKNKTLWIKVPKNSGLQVEDFKNVIAKYNGKMPVIIYDEEKKVKINIKSKYNINLCEELMLELEMMIPKECIKIVQENTKILS